MSHGLNLHTNNGIIAQTPGVGISLAAGATVPTDGTAGSAPGCTFWQTDGNSDTTYQYVNVGTRTSCNFDPVLVPTNVLATGAELNRAADVSTRNVPLAVTTAITVAAHEGRTIAMSGAGAARTFTLPTADSDAVGSKFRFVVAEVNTSGYLIKSARGADVMKGTVIGASTGDSATDAARTWTAGSTDDTITINGTTTGGVSIGDWIEIECLAVNLWVVRGVVVQSGAEATMFSDTVS